MRSRREDDDLTGSAANSVELSALLDGLDKGEGGAVHLVGGPGSGKTHALSQIRERARAKGMRVVAVSCVPQEQPFAWATLRTLLAPLRQSDNVSVTEAEATAELLDRLRPTADAPIPWFEAAMTTLELLSGVAQQHPLVLLVDDVEHADAASTEVLAALARRLAAEPILLVSARNAGAGDGELPGTTLRLDGLPEAEALQLLATHGVTDPATGLGLYEECNGHPLHLVELSRLLTPRQRSGVDPLPTPLPVVPSLEASYRAAFAELLPDEVTGLLVTAADVSARVSVVCAALAQLGEAPSVLDAAEERSLVRLERDHVHFDQPFVRSAVYYGATAPARRRVHQALADVDEDPERALWHRVRGCVGVDAAVADAVAEQAARTSRTGLFSAAAESYREAARLTVDQTLRADRWLDAAELALRAGLPQQARTALAEAAADRLGDTARLIRAAAVSVRLDVLDGKVVLAAESVNELLESASLASSEERERALDLVFAAIGPLMQTGDLRTTWQLAASVSGFADDDGPPLSPAGRARARIAQGIEETVRGRPVAGAPGLEAWRDLAAAAGPSASSEICETVAIIYGHTNRKAEAWAMLDELETLARRACSPAGLLPILVTRSALAYGVDFTACVALGDEATRLAEDTAQMGLTVGAWTCVALALAAQIEEDRCRKVVDRMLRENLGSNLAALAALGKLELLLGRAEAAIAVFERLAADESAARAPFRYESDHAEALIRASRPAEVAGPLAVLWADAPDNPWAEGHAHRIEALLSSGDDASEKFAKSVDAFNRTTNLYTIAQAEFQYGQHLRRLRRRGQARPLLESARARFETMGANGWLPLVDRELAAVGGPVATDACPTVARQRLTPAELQIARRVAAGESNREVARMLFVSPRTIETHLSTIYRKLGVRGRSGLAARAFEDATLRDEGLLV